MNKRIQAARDYVRRNKKHLLLEGTLIGVVVLQAKGIGAMNDFLREKNLLAEYYNLES